MHTTDAPPARGLRRDLALAARILGMLYHYTLRGGRLRGLYRRCEERGETFWVDEGEEPAHREAPLHRR
jgi:hypothetical protein